MQLNERFKYLRTEILKLSQADMGTLMGGLSQVDVANIESGRKKRIEAEIYANLAKTNVNLRWLIAEVGGPLVNGNCPPSNSEHVIPIPFYHVRASAGYGTLILEDVKSENVIFFDTRWLQDVIGIKPRNASLITAVGDSMDSGLQQKDDIKDGDILLVDHSITEGNNKIFVVQTNENELKVKKIKRNLDGTLTLISNNPNYKDVVYKGKDANKIKILGRVVWNGSQENL